VTKGRSISAAAFDNWKQDGSCKTMPRKHQFEIGFYRTARGVRPVRVFLRNLPVKDRIKCLSYLKRVRAEGIYLPKTYVEKIDDNLWEVKPAYNRIEYRFLFGFVGPNRIVFVTALKKKRMRLPRSIFDHAMALISEMQR
jgi:phage-related protein